ncbi:MAG: DUF11 domain-containing protein [Thermoleophilia bacterium]|nr:DUF11 domain-containing protein [Thermoleophilia bacterium]
MSTLIPRALTGAAALLLGVVAAASAATPFTSRYTTNAAGDISIIGNTSLTCPSSSGSCASVLAGANGINNSFAMEYVDIDSDASTFDSSSATLAMPTDAQVLFAGLYWGGRRTAGGGGGANAPDMAASSTVKLQVPGGAYATVTGTETGTYVNGSETSFQAFADVTSQVTAAGNGAYTVANVQLGTGSNSYGGWSLVVVYRDDAAPPRNLAVFDGLATVDSGNPNETITVTGMQAPPSGDVTARIGVVAYDGDRGSTGDTLLLNGTGLSDAEHPANDMFNSSFADRGVRQTAKSPDYANSLGIDASVFTADNLIANSATSATIALSTGGETYLPGVVTSAIDLYAPRLVVSKTVKDVDGGDLLAGDTLEYTISVSNQGTDSATNVVLSDVIPSSTTLVPGSLKITAGDGAGTFTDAGGDDRGDASASGVTVRLGAGGTATTGGTLAVGASTTAVFRAKIDTSAATGTKISNRADVAHNGASSNVSLLARSSTVAATVAGPAAAPTTPAPTSAKLSITIKGPSVLRARQAGKYVVTVRSLGPATAKNVQLRIPVPRGFTVVSRPKGFRLVKGVVIGPKMSLKKGATRRIVLSFKPTSAAASRLPARLTATARGAAVRAVRDRTPVRVVPVQRPAPAVTG